MVSPYSVAQSVYLLHTVFLKKRPRMPIIGKQVQLLILQKQIKNQPYLQAMRCAILHSTSAALAGIFMISCIKAIPYIGCHNVWQGKGHGF